MKIEGIDEARKPRAALLQRWLPPEPVEKQPEQAPSPLSDPRIAPMLEQLLQQLFMQAVLQMMNQVFNQLGAGGSGQPSPTAGGGIPPAGGLAGAAPAPAAAQPPSPPPTPAAPAIEAPAPAAAAAAPAPAAAPAAPAAESPSGTAAVNGGGPNSLNLRNNTDQPMQVAFFRNLAPGEHPSFNGPEATFTLKPHESLKVAMPEDWQGRVQKWIGSTQDNANWAEINFEKSTKKIWFDESDIPGRNSSIKITAPDGPVAGSDRSLLGQAPADIVTTDSSGQKVIKAPQWFTGETNQASVDFLDRTLGTSNAYVLPDDNNAVRVSEANSLTVDFGEA